MIFENIPVWALVLAGIIIFAGFLIFFYLSFKAYRKHKAIKHYEKIRDDLTLREPEKEEELESYGGFSLGRIIEGFIIILVAFTLMPTVLDQVQKVCTGGFSQNVTTAISEVLSCGGSAGTILGLVTLFFALGVIIVGISIAFGGMKDTGII